MSAGVWKGLAFVAFFAFAAGRGLAAAEDGRVCVSEGTSHDANGNPLIALTFDDGPHPTLTPKLLNILREEGVPATFYVVGELVRERPDIVRQAVEEGHEIGNHSWSHRDYRKLAGEQIETDLARTDGEVRKACGEGTYSTRPPYGAVNKKVLQTICERHGPAVTWTVDPLDWKRPGAGVVARRILDGAKPGAIVLAHDIHPGTIEAVPAVIRTLKERGYRFVTVSELLGGTTSISLE